jgi:hypothetical protein
MHIGSFVMRTAARSYAMILVTVVGCATCAATAVSSDDDADSLAGPKVVAPTDKKLSIVRRDFQGHVEQLEERPEIAAARLLTLDDATRAKVDEAIAKRAVLVSQITLDNYETFLKLQSEFAGGPPTTAEQRQQRMASVRTLREFAKPLFEPAFAEALAALVPTEQAKHFRAMVSEYKDAIVSMEAARGKATRAGEDKADQTDEAMGDGMSEVATTRRGSARAERIRARIDNEVFEVRQVGREMGQAFNAFAEQRQRQGEELYTLIDATPEQRAKIDKIVRERGETAALKPSEEHRREIFQRVLKELTPEQRRKLLDEYRGK